MGFFTTSDGTNLAKTYSKEPPKTFMEAAEAWIDKTGGATLPKHVIDEHPALLRLMGYASDEMSMADLDTYEFANTMLSQITKGSDGSLLWHHEGIDALLEVKKEWAVDVKSIGHSPETHPERHYYDFAQALMDETHSTPAMNEIRAMVKKNALPDARFTGVEPPSTVVSINTKKKPPAAKPEKPKPKHHQWLDAMLEDDNTALARIAEMPMVIENMIPAQSYGYFFGESGVGKSFVLLDIAHSVATGRPWLGAEMFKVEDAGLVVYVAAEGANGLRVRKKAIEQETGIDAPLLRILPAAPLLDTGDAHLVAETFKELERRLGEKVKLVVVDTLSQCAEGEQNSATDMAKFIHGCAEIQSNGASVVVVHHSGLADKDRMRGTTNLKAAGDFEFCVKGGDGLLSVKQTKSKDDENLPPVKLKTRKVEIDGLVKRNGKPFTSLVVEPANMADELNASRKLSDNETTLLATIKELAVDTNGHVSIEDARTAFYEAAKGKTKDASRKAFTRALRSIEERQLVVVEDDDIVIHST